mmetsp:Transcript_119964/g.340082  ORF Transcript_119964/g.340082 Transcript_119964/m.340082 type:complete len:462 (+) Transcript_119964:356-1741(+)
MEATCSSKRPIAVEASSMCLRTLSSAWAATRSQLASRRSSTAARRSASAPPGQPASSCRHPSSAAASLSSDLAATRTTCSASRSTVSFVLPSSCWWYSENSSNSAEICFVSRANLSSTCTLTTSSTCAATIPQWDSSRSSMALSRSASSPRTLPGRPSAMHPPALRSCEGTMACGLVSVEATDACPTPCQSLLTGLSSPCMSSNQLSSWRIRTSRFPTSCSIPSLLDAVSACICSTSVSSPASAASVLVVRSARRHTSSATSPKHSWPGMCLPRLELRWRTPPRGGLPSVEMPGLSPNLLGRGRAACCRCRTTSSELASRRESSSTLRSARQTFAAWRFCVTSSAAAPSWCWCSRLCTCCSSSWLRCFARSRPLVRAQRRSSRPSTRRANVCISSNRPFRLPCTSAHFSRHSMLDDHSSCRLPTPRSSCWMRRSAARASLSRCRSMFVMTAETRSTRRLYC